MADGGAGQLRVDGRLPASGFFAAGLWLLDAQSATAPGAALIAHGPNIAGTARLTVFAFNPLYRADPEREWPALASAAYWGGRRAAAVTAAPEPLKQSVGVVDVTLEAAHGRRG